MLWEKLGRFMAQNDIVCENGYSIYHDDEYKESEVDVEIAVPVDELKEGRGGFVYKELSAIPLAATVRFAGPYENYTPAMEKLAAWVEQNGYEFDGIVRGYAVSASENQNDCLTELQVPVRKA